MPRDHARNRKLIAVLSTVWMGTAIALATGGGDAPPFRLKSGDRLAILGDSITSERGYSVFVETYLLACAPQLDLNILQLGLSGETACGFTYRMEKDLMPWKPTVATICYGKNDGRYRRYEAALATLHDESMRTIVSRLKDAGATVVVGTPGLMDTFYYKSNDASANVYNNEVLDRFAVLDRHIAEDCKQPFADINTVMRDAMQKAKTALGEDYNVLGGFDGVHPHKNGHLIIAYAFLKALGMDGRIGTITVDWDGKSEASEGHKVLSVSNGVVAVESTRYPFCFKSKKETPQDKAEETASILPFVQFQEDLNRFVLVVKNLPAERASVKWGVETKTFSREQLARGINLAAEFMDNPMCAPFEAVLRAVGNKQCSCGLGPSVRTYFDCFKKDLKDDAGTAAALAVLQRKLDERKQVRDVDSLWYKTKRKYLDLNATIPDRYRKYEEEVDKMNNDPEILHAIDVLRPQLLAAQEKCCVRVRAEVKPVRHTIEIRPMRQEGTASDTGRASTPSPR